MSVVPAFPGSLLYFSVSWESQLGLADPKNEVAARIDYSQSEDLVLVGAVNESSLPA